MFLLGCDSTWSFYYKGKLNILKLLDKNLEFLRASQSIGSTFIQNPVLWTICLLYQQTQVEDVNVARYDILRLRKYCKRDMPCTKDVLRKHLNRVIYQAAIWRRALSPITDCPYIAKNDIDDGNDNDGNVSIPHRLDEFTTCPDGILENVQCGCKTGCTSNGCSCRKANLQCTSNCQCNNCSNANQESDESHTDADDIDENYFDDEH